MIPNMIVILPTDDREVIEEFSKILKDGEKEIVVMSDVAKILIKGEDGLWRELKK